MYGLFTNGNEFSNIKNQMTNRYWMLDTRYWMVEIYFPLKKRGIKGVVSF